MFSVAQLKKRHGVELGHTYMNDHVCVEFIDSVAEVYEEELNEVHVCIYLYYDPFTTTTS